MKEFQMSNRSNSTPVATGFFTASGVAALFNKLFFNRSLAIIWWTGLAALMAGFRIATSSGAEGDEMFRAWMIDWAVIWFTLAVISLRLLKPAFDYLVDGQNAHAEASMFRELSKLEPSFAQELQSMTMHQQMRDEQAAENTKASAEALASLGGLTNAQSAKSANAVRLGSRLGSAT
jgi:hypothetical protein